MSRPNPSSREEEGGDDVQRREARVRALACQRHRARCAAPGHRPSDAISTERPGRDGESRLAADAKDGRAGDDVHVLASVDTEGHQPAFSQAGRAVTAGATRIRAEAANLAGAEVAVQVAAAKTAEIAVAHDVSAGDRAAAVRMRVA